jgi:hypothetical protein
MTDLEHDHLTAGLRLVASITLESMKSLPLTQQITACDGLHHALKANCPNEAKAAAATADALRRADAAQLTFREILNQTA